MSLMGWHGSSKVTAPSLQLKVVWEIINNSLSPLSRKAFIALSISEIVSIRKELSPQKLKVPIVSGWFFTPNKKIKVLVKKQKVYFINQA